ncbi:hypothetical protein HU200_052429 [Digitaria exilis]|uniref:Uncharacterized protein n=1 Tax=Digitaria exilis TaxID=1010633 RepID=A0A835AR68_9POAL|nr:hypothetical protein HU200_052429 [Digitaria exilis]
MTTTPEEFFAMGLMEQSPPSPPVFVDIPQKPSASSDSQHRVPENMMLPHISRVLFEDENIDDKLRTQDNRANKILDEMMLQAYQTCIWGMDKLRVTVENKNMKCTGRKASRNNVVDVRALLISCAEAVAANDHMRVHELLKQIKKHASETRDATQRLAQCFTNGLEARLKGARGQISQFLIARPSFMDILEAYNLYFTACCFNGVTFIFSVMTIMKYMVGKSRLHIVDYDKYGLPPFKFHIVMKKWEDVCIKDLSIDIDEVLVVNDLLNFNSLMDESVFFDDPSPRDIVLNNIKKMKPDVFIQSIVNCSYGSSFITRFRETMFYYMALFDILDATVPRESKSRLVLEQFVLGSSALNAIASEGVDLVEHPEKYRQRQARNQRIGLRQLPLKSRIIKVPGEVYGGARGEHEFHSPWWGDLVEEPHGDAEVGIEVLEEEALACCP